MRTESTGSNRLSKLTTLETPGIISPGMNALGGTIWPETIRFMTWKKSRSLFSLNERRAAYWRSFSLISFDRSYSSWIEPSFSVLCRISSWTVLSCHNFILESLPPVIIIRFGRSASFVSRVSEKSIAHIFSSCISNELRQDCFATFQTFTIPSTEADAS